MKITYTLLITLVLATMLRAADIVIPSARRATTWAPNVEGGVGVVGGIPNAVGGVSFWQEYNAVTFGADPTGEDDSTAAFNACIAQAFADGKGCILFIPAGTYKIVEGTSRFHIVQHGIIIRGAGMGQTFIDSRVNLVQWPQGKKPALFAFGTASSFNDPANLLVTAGNAKDSKVLTVSDTAAFEAEEVILLSWENMQNDAAIMAGAAPVIATKGNFPWMRREVKRIVSKTGTTLTIEPGIVHTPQAGLALKVNASAFPMHTSGVEDLTMLMDNGPATFPIVFNDAYNVWVKNVEIRNIINYAVVFNNCVNWEVRHCVFRDRQGTGSNGAGILTLGACNGLVYDNIFKNIAPLIEYNFGSAGNVFAYNYGAGNLYNTNHGAHNSCNLYEGNVGPGFQWDGYHGSSSDDTTYRNYLDGDMDPLDAFFVPPIIQNRFTRNINVIGNILGSATYNIHTMYSLGNPNMGNSSFDESVSMQAGNFPSDWKSTGILTTRTSATEGMITLTKGTMTFDRLEPNIPEAGFMTITGIGTLGGTIGMAKAGTATENFFFTLTAGTLPAEDTPVGVIGGQLGYQFQDLDCELTSLFKANYWNGNGVSGFTDGIPATEVTTDTLPASLYLTSKPAWMGNLPYPPFDPNTPVFDVTRIPAGWREINGNEDYLGDTSIPIFSPIPGTYTTAQNITLTSATSGATIHFTLDGTTPTSGSTVFSTPIPVSTTTTIKAFALKAGLDDSSVTTGIYNFQAAAPVFDPVAPYSGVALSVAISSTTSGSTIRYTINGTTPSDSVGTVYDGSPVGISSTTTLKAITFKSGLDNSTVTSGVYTITGGSNYSVGKLRFMRR